MHRGFQLVDVFGAEPFTGNPLAVLLNGEGLETEEMQRITRWFNLSETSFLLPPTQEGADYRVRIFTPERELSFAGHPTLGSCHAWLEAGGRPRRSECIVQQCGAGLIEIRHMGDRLAFRAPSLVRSGTPTDAELAEAARVARLDPGAIVDAQWTDNGPGWISLMLKSADAVLRVKPATAYERPVFLGVIGPYDKGNDARYEVRAFFSDPYGGVVEDPVTGSLNAALAQWMYDSGRANGDYIVSQGTAMGRKGRVYVSRDMQGDVWIGGACVTLFAGRSSF